MPRAATSPFACARSTSSPGAGTLLRLIRDGQASTRAELVALTGLARSTVAQRMDALLSQRLVVPAGGSGSTGGGRARTQVGNLAHALKTPLAVITNEARGDKTGLGAKVAEQATFGW